MQQACARCTHPLPVGARFCPSCGHPVAAAEAGSLTLDRVEPRLFGVMPPLATLGLGLVALAVGALALATGHWVLGTVVTLGGLVLASLFVEAARRFRPSDAASRTAVGLAERLRDWLGFAAGSAGAWSRAGRELLAARRELAALRVELERTQLELGAAAFRKDDAEVARLRARMRELDERARERAGLTHEAVEDARRRTDDERMAIQPTEVVEIDRERLP
ncbi:MAG TPA: zinc ribbon domain-containing protein [Gaiellaceae bacterium]|nr:zinc ribbon domain-containing protein [Gaiellaceae bacterium]